MVSSSITGIQPTRESRRSGREHDTTAMLKTDVVAIEAWPDDHTWAVSPAGAGHF
jgi:hypothetical protein